MQDLIKNTTCDNLVNYSIVATYATNLFDIHTLSVTQYFIIFDEKQCGVELFFST